MGFGTQLILHLIELLRGRRGGGGGGGGGYGGSGGRKSTGRTSSGRTAKPKEPPPFYDKGTGSNIRELRDKVRGSIGTWDPGRFKGIADKLGGDE